MNIMKAASYTSSDSDSILSSEDGTDASHPPPQYSTAGLFLVQPTDKPLPLAAQRSIPLPRFWKLSSHHHSSNRMTDVAPDILRRTGSTTSTYSNESAGGGSTFPSGTAEDRHVCLGATRGAGRERNSDARRNPLRASRSMDLDDAMVGDDLQYSIYSSSGGHHNVMHFLKQRFVGRQPRRASVQ